MGSRDDPDDFVPSSTLGASQLNPGPRGCILGLENDSNTAPTTELATVLEDDFVVLSDDRRIRIVGSLTGKSDITGGIQGALHLDGVQVQRRNEDSILGGAFISWTIPKDLHLDAGTYHIALIIGVSGVAGNEVISVADGSDGTRGNSTLTVDDVGPRLT